MKGLGWLVGFGQVLIDYWSGSEQSLGWKVKGLQSNLFEPIQKFCSHFECYNFGGVSIGGLEFEKEVKVLMKLEFLLNLHVR